MELVNTIKSLADRYGVSGDEYGVSAQAAELLRPYMDRVEVDKLGNVIGYRSCGKEGAKKLLLDAHLDQIGFVITEVLEEGFCRFIGIGVVIRMAVRDDERLGTMEVVVDPLHLGQGPGSRIYVQEPAIVFDEHPACGPDLIHGRVTTAAGPQESNAEAHDTRIVADVIRLLRTIGQSVHPDTKRWDEPLIRSIVIACT